MKNKTLLTKCNRQPYAYLVSTYVSIYCNLVLQIVPVYCVGAAFQHPVEQ